MADWSGSQGDGQLVTSVEYANSTLYSAPTFVSGSAHNKGSYQLIHSALPFDVCGVWVAQVSNGDNAQYLADIAVGTSTAEQVVISNLWAPAIRTGGAQGHGFYMPLRFPRGARVSGRAQSSISGSGCTFDLKFFSAGFAGNLGFGRCTTYGIDTATSAPSTPNLDPGGTANTKGSYQTITASTTNPISTMFVAVDIRNAAATSATWRMDIAMGAANTIILPDLSFRTEATSDALGIGWFGPLPVSVPAGVALKARVQCTITDATDRLIRGVSIYGLD